MKITMLFLGALLLAGCAGLVPLEEHGGLSPKVSKVTDAEFVAIGAGFDLLWGATAGKLLHQAPVFRHLDPNLLRAAADATFDYCLRSCSTFGRSVDSGFLAAYGQVPVNIGRAALYGLQHPSHPDCWVTRGPDTAVTHAVTLLPQKGRRWGNECLTWEEERRLRHQW